MVIAVTHDNGNVDKHFGHAKEFKLYEVENGEVVDSAVVSNYQGGGHEAACMLMEDYNVAVVICDNIGAAAIDGLQEISVSVIPNVEGSCDDALKAFLSGQLMMQIQGGGGCSGCDPAMGGCSGCSPQAGCSGCC